MGTPPPNHHAGMTGAPRMLLTTIFYMISIAASSLASYDFISQESNSIFPTNYEVLHQQHYPSCLGNSICAFLQANDKGVSVVRYCQCGILGIPGVQCPVTWDQFDGKSITQTQSDQYKYCDKAPQVPRCSHSSQVAYTSWQRYHHDKKVASRDDILCECPEGHNYLDTKYDFSMDGEDSIVLIEYFCLPLPPCNATEFCKDITAKPGEYIVNPKCLCQDGLVCPSITDRGVKTSRFGEMIIHNIQCQERFSGRQGVPHDLYFKRRISGRDKNKFFKQLA